MEELVIIAFCKSNLRFEDCLPAGVIDSLSPARLIAER
jgi:hypothetical protein